MKIAISTDGGFVSPHFGRCPTFTIVEIENGEIIKLEEVANPGHHPGYLPRFLSDKGVAAIICGGMGQRARPLFAECGIEVVMGVQGRIGDIVEKYIRGEIVSGESLCTPGAGKGHGLKKSEGNREGGKHAAR